MGTNDVGVLSKTAAPESKPSKGLPDGEALKKSANAMLTMARMIKIDSPGMYTQASEDLLAIKAKADSLEAQRMAITRPMDEAKKNVMDLFRAPAEFLKLAETDLKARMVEYVVAEKKKADEKQRLLDEEAQHKRLEIEKQQRVAEAEATALREQADLLTASGDDDGAAHIEVQVQTALIEADTLQSAAATHSAVVVQSAAPAVRGIGTRATWKAKITDKIALIRYIGEHPEYIDWVEVGMTPLNSLAKAQKRSMQIPGVVAYEDVGISARR